MTPFFSVIITTYNRPVRLIRAVQSVLDQEYQSFEILIVNDGSTVSYSVVEDFINGKDEIRYFYKKNEERSIARNYGIEKAKGKFICFLDDDDYYLPIHLITLHDRIKNNNYGIGIYHTYSIIKEKDGSLKRPNFATYNPSKGVQEFYITEGQMTMNSTCGSKIIFKEFPYDPKLVYAEDHNQRLRVMSKYPVYQINEYTNVYDKSEETSTTQKNINVVKGYIDSWNYIFSLSEINGHIRPNFRESKLFLFYHLLLCNHRLELTSLEFIRASLILLKLKPSRKSLRITFDNLRWKLGNR